MNAMSTFREESEERTIHRLEAFSDIIIGFSLAQMTMNLVLPADVLDLFTKNYVSLLAFGLTFAIVSGMWWSHHRVFTHYFVPTPFNIVLNFMSLGGVMFLVYSLQVFLHATVHQRVAYVMYSGAVAWVIGILAFLTYRGMTLRGERMNEQLLVLGRRRVRRAAIIALMFAVIAALNATLPGDKDTQGYVVLAFMLLLVLMRYVESRIAVHRTR
jgi:uncharacterized membrane protein